MNLFTRRLIVLLSLSFFACTKGNEMNGSSMKSANRSASYIKNRLPLAQRIEFEFSFWTLLDEHKDQQAFLQAIDGKTHLEIIDMGRELFNTRKQDGQEEYQKFASWEDMVTQFSEDRTNMKKEQQPAQRRNQPTVLYDF